MELRFFLKSKTPSAIEGTCNLVFAPVEGAAENEEFIGEATGDICLDNVKEEAVAELAVPTEDESQPMEKRRTFHEKKEIAGKIETVRSYLNVAAHQQFLVTITRA